MGNVEDELRQQVAKVNKVEWMSQLSNMEK